MKPILLGIVNAFVPGLSYLILRKRVVFGTLLVLGMLSWLVLSFVEPSHPLGWNAPMLYATTMLGMILEGGFYVFAMAAFGYDAYRLARGVND